MKRRIEAILFDMGGTLMTERLPWPPVLEVADRALTTALAAGGIQLEPAVFRQRVEAYYSLREQELYETTYHLVLRELLRELGHAEVSESLLRTALDAMFRVTQENWELRHEALPVLKKLAGARYRLAIISNAGDDKDAQQLVDRFGIRTYLDFVLTSAACSFRKPHPRIFELALARWLLEPDQVAMVGDTLEADIAGAARLGIHTIWLAPDGAQPMPGNGIVQPAATLHSLADIPVHLGGLS
jgi:putative hydrolase of the HAD superfamily